MSTIDVESLLQEISPDQPCGEDLEYDPGFGEMERAAQGSAAQEMGDGNEIAAVDPDWRSVKNQAVELLGRSKDLRVAVYLARALLQQSGHVGFCDGLALVRGLMERYWEPIHPALDPDDDNDPTLRVNTLVALFDAQTTLAAVKDAPLVRSNILGSFGLRHTEIVAGLASPHGDEEIPDSAAIDGAFLECDVEELQATTDAVGQAVEHVQAIDAVLTEKVGAAQAADFSPLTAALSAAHVILAEQLGRRGVAVDGPDGVAAPAAAVQAAAGEINSREDVVRVLDRACDYLARAEPSSPVPLLLRRAKRLISKDFLEIMRDLAPDGVPQAESIGGVTAAAEDTSYE